MEQAVEWLWRRYRRHWVFVMASVVLVLTSLLVAGPTSLASAWLLHLPQEMALKLFGVSAACIALVAVPSGLLIGREVLGPIQAWGRGDRSDPHRSLRATGRLTRMFLIACGPLALVLFAALAVMLADADVGAWGLWGIPVTSGASIGLAAAIVDTSFDYMVRPLRKEVDALLSDESSALPSRGLTHRLLILLVFVGVSSSVATAGFVAQVDDTQRHFVTAGAAALAFALFFGVTALSFGLVPVLRPVHDLVAATKRVADGDFTQRLPVTSGDELGVLARSFNLMQAGLSEQQRLHTALEVERAKRLHERQNATVLERQRIAREIHDLVAHSLSVTLLQIAGARRAIEQDDTVDARAALQDAEIVGRQAMSDIRRTVGLLNTDAPEQHALPDASDIHVLVDQMTRAGLAVDLDLTGELHEVPPAAGLGLYRVIQESLANVAKHAPASTAHVQVTVTATAVDVTIDNDYPADATISQGHGTGGVRSRVEQLGGIVTIGRAGDRWVVDAHLPLAEMPTESLA